MGFDLFDQLLYKIAKKKNRRVNWLWDMEGWVLSVVGMAADRKVKEYNAVTFNIRFLAQEPPSIVYFRKTLGHTMVRGQSLIFSSRLYHYVRNPTPYLHY